MTARDQPQPDADRHDPTKNVLDLVRAEGRRQDDLREMNDRHLRDMITVRADANRELIAVRAEYEDRLRLAEAKRIDAIREVDVAALQRATEVAMQQANALAAQVTTVAETLRESQRTELSLLRDEIGRLRENQAAVAAATGGARAQVAETRSAAGENRLNMSAVVGLLALLVAMVLPFVLLLTR